MTRTITVRIGTADDMGRRFVDAWKRAERGEAVDETNITFVDLEALLATLTPKRLALLRHVRRNPVGSIRALAENLGRNYKNVHQDIEKLGSLGLITRTPTGVEAPFAEVDARLVL